MDNITHYLRKKATLVVILFVAVFVSIASKGIRTGIVEEVNKRLQSSTSQQAREALYVHTNGASFVQGDTIWFKAYNQTAGILSPSSLGEFLCVGLYDKSGNSIVENRFTLESGAATGHIVLSDSIKPGRLILAAGSNYTLANFPDDMFKKEIEIGDVGKNEVSIKISMTDSIYNINSLIVGELEVFGEMNSSLAQLKVKVELVQGQDILDKKIIKTGEDGIGKFEMLVPEKLGKESVFLKAQILQSGLSGSLSLNLQIASLPPNIRFFPEGGQLVDGIATQIAIEANDYEGNSFDFCGIIIDSLGQEVSETATSILGMGSLKILPDLNRKLFFKIIKPKGYNKLYELPQAVESGFLLNVLENRKGKVLLKVESNSCMPNDSVSVIIYLRNKVYFTTTKPIKELDSLSVNVKTMPMGVAKITVFDKNGTPRAERLAFLNHNKKLKVKCDSLKNSYSMKEKVTVSLEILDHSKKPVSGNFSMSVSPVNNTGIFNDIVSSLLLCDELKGKIPASNYYFSENPASEKAIDLLMLTHGWRKFTWEDVIAGNILATKSGTALSGRVTTKNGKPIKNGDVILMNVNTFQTESTKTNKDGQFWISDSDFHRLSDNSTLVLTATGPGGKKNVIIELNDIVQDEQLSSWGNSLDRNKSIVQDFNVFESEDVKRRGDSIDALSKSYYSDITHRNFWIDDVEIKAKRPVVIPVEVYEKKHKTFKMDESEIFINMGSDPQSGIIQLLREVAGSFTIANEGEILFRGYNSIYPENQQGAVIVVNGRVAGFHCNDINYLSAGDIQEIKVTKSSAAGLRYTSFATGGLIEITTKNAKLENFRSTPVKPAGNMVKIPGYCLTKEYYSPVYTNSEESKRQIDLRTTLFWNPNISISESGKTSIEYFNSDVPGEYELKLEGVSESGTPVNLVTKYIVIR